LLIHQTMSDLFFKCFAQQHIYFLTRGLGRDSGKQSRPSRNGISGKQVTKRALHFPQTSRPRPQSRLRIIRTTYPASWKNLPKALVKDDSTCLPLPSLPPTPSTTPSLQPVSFLRSITEPAARWLHHSHAWSGEELSYTKRP
jgi:hypothetical protein